MSGLFTNEDFSPQLFSIWRELLAEKKLPAMDRWLKNRNNIGPSTKTHRPKNTSGVPLTLSAALISGVRFMQLACALEHAYTLQRADLDWALWDAGWQYGDVKKIPLGNFWYWIELRINGLNERPPQKMRDQEARALFFTKCLSVMDNSENLSGFLLWYGLRPQWHTLLQQRAAVSGWSELELQKFVRLQVQTPPLWLRAQRGKTTQEIYERLRQEGVNVHLNEALELSAQGGKGLNGTETFKEGFVEIQDLASQHIALSVAAQPGNKVWDACAGAGGKSLAIAARMNNKGVIVATDLHDYKLAELKRRGKRAEYFNLRSFIWDGEAPLRLPKEVAQQKGFDWVLIDAPCSSAGTWRRNPDARWRFSAPDTAELIHLQRKLLVNAASAVRQGGYLVYATCSWQVSENEDQVEWFTAHHSQFRLESQRILGAPVVDADTMFAAVLKRL